MGLFVIEGKDVVYEFLVDLRPIAPPERFLPDPLEKQRKRSQEQQILPKAIKRRNKLRADCEHLDRDIKKKQESVFTMEKEFYEIMTRRRLRQQENKRKKEELVKFVLGAEELERKLQETRAEWLERLESDYDLQDQGNLPYIEEVATLQVKVDKLQLKRDELLRSIHPERYAVADVSRVGSVPMELPTPTKTGSDLITPSGSHMASREVSEPAISREQSPTRHTAPSAIEDGVSEDEALVPVSRSSQGGAHVSAQAVGVGAAPVLPMVGTQGEDSTPTASGEPEAKRPKVSQE